MNIDSTARRLRGCTHRAGKALMYEHTETQPRFIIKHYRCKDCGKAIALREMTRPEGVTA